MRHLIFCGNGCLFLCLEVRKSNVFEAVKQSVTTSQAAEFYGIPVGRNGMACCPFHDDKHPSMKVDRRFHCFGCQADGDVIDFTARLFGLSNKEAALKLAEDFSVRYDAKGHDPPRKRPVKRKISEELRYRQAEQKCFRVLCDYLHLLERWEKEYARRRRRKHGIRCLWRPCKRNRTRSICWIFCCPAAWRNGPVWSLNTEKR